MDEVMNTEEIVEPEEANEIVETECVDDEGKTSMLPAVGVGIAIGAAALYAVPKAAKGIKELVVKGKNKVASKIAEKKAAKETEEDYVVVKGTDEK